MASVRVTVEGRTLRPDEEDEVETTTVLEVAGVAHRYGATVALEEVDLTVAAGECVALLGPNGAGKTTLVNAVVSLLAPDEGRVRILGRDPREAAARRHLGVVQQSVGFPRTLRVGELVRGAAVRHGVPAGAAGAVLAETGLGELARRRTHHLSGGQQQRLQLAVATVGDPELLVLDEPTVGLDATARRDFWRLLAARKARGTGILLTTHLIEESAQVADRVVVLDRGRVVAVDTPERLRTRLPDRRVIFRTSLTLDRIAEHPEAVAVDERDGFAIVSTRSPEALLRFLLDADPGLHDLRVEGASLEEAVVGLTSVTEQEVAA
jgi:ABC-2 type transport system ATP-binding protein